MNVKFSSTSLLVSIELVCLLLFMEVGCFLKGKKLNNPTSKIPQVIQQIKKGYKNTKYFINCVKKN